MIDVGFGIRASEINSSAIFTVMTETRDTINHRYGPGQVQYSVTVYGSKVTTNFNFDLDNALNLNALIAATNQLLDVPGPVDLPQVLTDAERLFQSHPNRRPFSERVFIAITDTAKSDNDSALISAGDALRRQGLLVFSVNNTGDGLNAVTITQIDFLGFPTFTTVRSVVIAETIIKKALEGNKESLGIHNYINNGKRQKQKKHTHTRKSTLREDNTLKRHGGLFLSKLGIWFQRLVQYFLIIRENMLEFFLLTKQFV